MTTRILVLSAGFNLALNEMSMVWKHLADHRDVEICVIAPGADMLKGAQSQPGSQRVGSMHMHWVTDRFPLSYSPTIASIAQTFQPDLVFVGPREQLGCGRAIADACKVPLILHTEYFYTDQLWVRRREYYGLAALMPLVARRIRQRTLRSVEHLFVSDPQEKPWFEANNNISYLPWPHPAEFADEPVPQGQRDLSRLIFIGSLFRAKGAERLSNYFTAALRQLPDLRVDVVGPAVDAAGEAALKTMSDAAPDRFSWRRTVPRPEAIQLLSHAFCVLSPGDAMGWGQIGDAWRQRTPVIAYREHYDLQHETNCLVAPSEAAFVDSVTRLRHDAGLRERLAAGGWDAVQGHTLQATEAALWAGVQNVLPRRQVDQVRIPPIADTHSKLITDGVPHDRGHPGWGA